VQLEPFKDRRAGALSGGMKQKLALCCALIHKPEVLFLDEPTTGVDVVSRKEFWDMLKRLKAQDISILVSTSYMDEASLCDRIGLILGGKMLQIDSTENIIKSYPEQIYGVRTEQHMHKLLMDLRNYDGTDNCYTFGEYLHIILKSSKEDALNYLQRKGYSRVEFKEVTPTVEDSFIRLLKPDERNGNKNEQAN
jgi:ABC-type multidrug transport system ATPase subunit